MNAKKKIFRKFREDEIPQMKKKKFFFLFRTFSEQFYWTKFFVLCFIFWIEMIKSNHSCPLYLQQQEQQRNNHFMQQMWYEKDKAFDFYYPIFSSGMNLLLVFVRKLNWKNIVEIISLRLMNNVFHHSMRSIVWSISSKHIRISKANKSKSSFEDDGYWNIPRRISSRHHAIRLLEKFYESKVFTDAMKTDRKKTFAVEHGIYQ